MLTGWQLISGKWYYLRDSGAMVADRWIGDYYLSHNGAMATDQWIGDYYVDASGKWVPDKVR
jgi:glucan-binding YG repeat protein